MTASGQFARAAQIIPDIDGDGLDEIAISARVRAPSAGNIYSLVRPLSGRVEGAGPADAATSADRIIQGPVPGAAGNFRMGRRRGGFTEVGRPNGMTTGPKDIAFPESFELYNSLYIFSGATLASGTAGQMYQTTADVQTLAAPSIATDSERGFGARAIGELNLLGMGNTDLIASYPLNNSVQIYHRSGNMFPRTARRRSPSRSPQRCRSTSSAMTSTRATSPAMATRISSSVVIPIRWPASIPGCSSS